MAQVVSGYHAIALPLAHSAFRRFIYVKKHNVKESELSGESLLAAERTAYVVNLPPSADGEWLRARLEPAVGAIQHIVSGSGIKSSTSSSDALLAKTAHVVFKSKDALKKVLQVTQLELSEDGDDEENEDSAAATTGLQGYLSQYRANKPGLAAVKAIADQYMSKFDADEQEVRSQYAVAELLDEWRIMLTALLLYVRLLVMVTTGLPTARGAQGAGGRRRLQDRREHEEAHAGGCRGPRPSGQEAEEQGDGELLPLPDARAQARP